MRAVVKYVRRTRRSIDAVAMACTVSMPSSPSRPSTQMSTPSSSATEACGLSRSFSRSGRLEISRGSQPKNARVQMPNVNASAAATAVAPSSGLPVFGSAGKPLNGTLRPDAPGRTTVAIGTRMVSTRLMTNTVISRSIISRNADGYRSDAKNRRTSTPTP